MTQTKGGFIEEYVWPADSGWRGLFHCKIGKKGVFGGMLPKVRGCKIKVGAGLTERGYPP